MKAAATPGTFRFSVLDNGVVSNEYWRIIDVSDDLSWGERKAASDTWETLDNIHKDPTQMPLRPLQYRVWTAHAAGCALALGSILLSRSLSSPLRP